MKINCPLFCGFHSRNGTQSTLANLLTNGQVAYLDKSRVVFTMIIDLSKGLDCLPHELILAKLYPY